MTFPITSVERYVGQDGRLTDTGQKVFQSMLDAIDLKIADAPLDGSQYARKDGAWEVATGGGGSGVYDVAKRSSTSTGTAAPQLIIPWQTGIIAGTDITWASGNNTRLTIGTTGTYRIGAYLTYSSATQRAQANGQILINGTWEGDFRGDTYVRNSGSSWDFGVVEIASEPFEMTAADYFEIALARTSGANASYATGATGTITLRGQSCRVWVERMA